MMPSLVIPSSSEILSAPTGVNGPGGCFPALRRDAAGDQDRADFLGVKLQRYVSVGVGEGQ